MSKSRWIFNIVTVWFLTGFWHGAAWNFIVWGIYFVLFLMIEKFLLMPYLNKAKWGNHIYVLFFVMISFMIFDASSLQEAFRNIGGLFGIGNSKLISKESIYYLKNYFVTFAIAILAATPLPVMVYGKLQNIPMAKKIMVVAEPVITAAVLVIITAFLVDGSFNPFLYFRF